MRPQFLDGLYIELDQNYKLTKALVSNVKVSIIIVSWNTRDVLYDCLASIYKEARNFTFEVIIIDNASSDSSTEMVKKEFPQVILIENQENKGFAAANNQGIAKSEGRYILFLNSDTVILDHAIEKSVEFADAHLRAAVVGCRVLNRDRTVQQTCFRFPSALNMLLSSSYLYKLFPKSRFFGRERMTWWNRNDVREVDAVTGCFMLVRLKAIEQVGKMDERFFMYGEETDWCYRFKQAGWKVLFAPVAEIIHLGGQSALNQVGPMLLQLRGSILLFFKKHRSSVEYVLACALTVLFFVLRIPVWAFRSVLPRQGRRDARQRCCVYAKGVVLALMGGSRLCTMAKPR